MKNYYYHSKYFEDKFSKLKNSGQRFTLISTTYTKKIITETCKIFFNNEGSSDDRLLGLINLVRNDAKLYLQNGGICRNTHIDFFNLFEVPDNNDIICKVDIRSAYWKAALQNLIIQLRTNEAHKKMFEKQDINEDFDQFTERKNETSKSSRLKALGSLATTKITTTYENKKQYGDQIVDVSPTKQIYLEVCRIVDDLMKECVGEVQGCVYYYWDCIFVKKKFSQDAIEFFRKKNFETRMDETKLEFIKLNNDVGYLLSMSDDKMYMTKRENKHLLENIKL